MCRERTGYVIPTHVTTNGTLVDEEKAEGIIQSGLDSIIFSFQGVDVEGYMEMRNASLETTAMVYENLYRLVKMREDREYPYIQVTTTITDEQDIDVDSFINNLFDMGVDSVGVGKTNLHRVSNDKMKELKPRDTIYRDHFRCTEVYQKLSVDWDGKVSCCCGDPDNYMTIGDISNMEDCLYNLWWKSKKLVMIRELLKEKEHRSFSLCKDCYLTHEWRKNDGT
jgi:hypothetical protein